MTIAEELRQEAADIGVEVIDYKFASDRIKGLYCDGVIGVRAGMTSAEEAAVLAEELGHHYTAAGNILDQSDAWSRKQELRGRMWAYDRLIGLDGLRRVCLSGCTSRYEAAEALGVPEDMLEDAVRRYRAKYGA